MGKIKQIFCTQKICTQEIFIILLIAIPFLRSQWIVGTLVNVTLFSSVYFLGIKKSLPLAFIPSLIALSSGLMPVCFLVPIIGISNLVLIMLFDRYKKNLFKAIILASVGKACLFFLISCFSPICGYIFGSIQLATALLGGLIFFKGRQYLNIVKKQ